MARYTTKLRAVKPTMYWALLLEDTGSGADSRLVARFCMSYGGVSATCARLQYSGRGNRKRCALCRIWACARRLMKRKLAQITIAGSALWGEAVPACAGIRRVRHSGAGVGSEPSRRYSLGVAAEVMSTPDSEIRRFGGAVDPVSCNLDSTALLLSLVFACRSSIMSGTGCIGMRFLVALLCAGLAGSWCIASGQTGDTVKPQDP